MVYASRTGTKRNLAAFRAAGWRVLVSARGVLRTEGFPYAIDNGAWTSHQEGTAFDDAALMRAVYLLGAGADWVVCPDIVMGGMGSLAMSLRWLPWVLDRARLALIPVQNGMVAADLAPHIGPRVGIFVGGDDAFKEGTMGAWARLAREHGAYCHVGRVNTRGRVGLCAAAGVDSFDGTSGSRFAVNVPKIDAWRRQTSFLALVPHV
jgi:hypothetical protein